MRVAVDTDVVIRLLTGDDPEKQRRAAALFESAGRGEVELAIPSTVVADAVFVLVSPRLYALDRHAAAQMLLSLITLPGVEPEHRDRTLEALATFAESNVDFGDAYLAAFARELPEPAVYSFDKDFDKLSGIRRLEP